MFQEGWRPQGRTRSQQNQCLVEKWESKTFQGFPWRSVHEFPTAYGWSVCSLTDLVGFPLSDEVGLLLVALSRCPYSQGAGPNDKERCGDQCANRPKREIADHLPPLVDERHREGDDLTAASVMSVP